MPDETIANIHHEQASESDVDLSDFENGSNKNGNETDEDVDGDEAEDLGDDNEEIDPTFGDTTWTFVAKYSEEEFEQFLKKEHQSRMVKTRSNENHSGSKAPFVK